MRAKKEFMDEIRKGRYKSDVDRDFLIKEFILETLIDLRDALLKLGNENGT